MLVTGGASGIGRATVDRLARDGAHVVVADTQIDAAAEAVDEVERAGGNAQSVEVDVSDHASVVAAVGAIAAEHGRLDGAFNNAGIGGPTAKVLEIDPAQWAQVLAVNLTGVFNCVQAELAQMVKLESGGSIVNTASMAGHFPGHSAYTASKWAVVGITLGLFRELEGAGSNVGVSCLCPGWVRTKIAESDRNIPEWAVPRTLVEPTEEQQAAMAFITEALASGMEPDEVGELVYDAVTDGKFWIFTDMGMVAMLEDKHASIMENRNPAPFTLLQ